MISTSLFLYQALSLNTALCLKLSLIFIFLTSVNVLLSFSIYCYILLYKCFYLEIHYVSVAISINRLSMISFSCLNLMRHNFEKLNLRFNFFLYYNLGNSNRCSTTYSVVSVINCETHIWDSRSYKKLIRAATVHYTGQCVNCHEKFLCFSATQNCARNLLHGNLRNITRLL